jgi:hypothetical protein
MKTKLTLLIGGISFAILSCQKEVPDNISRKDLLTGGAWIVQKAEENDNNGPFTDVFTLWASCDKDNTWHFKPDFSLVYNEGAMACGSNTSNQVLDIVTWVFAENESQIIADGITYSIGQLDANTLIISETEIAGAVTASRRTTFRH